jgi:hypothetical protein
MKIPKSLFIGAVKYEIEICEKIPGPESGALAYIEYDKTKIWVARGEASEQISQIALCHEIVHAMLREISGDRLMKDERIVDLLARQLYTLIEKNRGAL